MLPGGQSRCPLDVAHRVSGIRDQPKCRAMLRSGGDQEPRTHPRGRSRCHQMLRIGCRVSGSSQNVRNVALQALYEMPRMLRFLAIPGDGSPGWRHAGSQDASGKMLRENGPPRRGCGRKTCQGNGLRHTARCEKCCAGTVSLTQCLVGPGVPPEGTIGTMSWHLRDLIRRGARSSGETGAAPWRSWHGEATTATGARSRGSGGRSRTGGRGCCGTHGKRSPTGQAKWSRTGEAEVV